jgi:hypothetical protein
MIVRARIKDLETRKLVSIIISGNLLEVATSELEQHTFENLQVRWCNICIDLNLPVTCPIHISHSLPRHQTNSALVHN